MKILMKGKGALGMGWGRGCGEKGYAFWRNGEKREWLGKRNKSKISRSIFTKQFYS